jgi:hypothetical protein
MGLQQGNAALYESTGDGHLEGWFHFQRSGDKKFDKRDSAAGAFGRDAKLSYEPGGVGAICA